MGHHHSVARPGPHDAFDVIAAAGNFPGFDFASGQLIGRGGNNFLICADGFEISVIAGAHAHSHGAHGNSMMLRPIDIRGPYSTVECGRLSVRPEPWDVWESFTASEGPDSIYSYVPVPIVRRLLDSHGGVRRASGASRWSLRPIADGERVPKALRDDVGSLMEDLYDIRDRTLKWEGK